MMHGPINIRLKKSEILCMCISWYADRMTLRNAHSMIKIYLYPYLIILFLFLWDPILQKYQLNCIAPCCKFHRDGRDDDQLTEIRFHSKLR